MFLILLKSGGEVRFLRVVDLIVELEVFVADLWFFLFVCLFSL